MDPPVEIGRETKRPIPRETCGVYGWVDAERDRRTGLLP
jgi:hypothetical protein